MSVKVVTNETEDVSIKDDASIAEDNNDASNDKDDVEVKVFCD